MQRVALWKRRAHFQAKTEKEVEWHHEKNDESEVKLYIFFCARRALPSTGTREQAALQKSFPARDTDNILKKA